MRTKTRSLSEEALEQILTKARTHNGWLPESVSDELLGEVGANQRQFISGANRIC